MIIVVDYGIGNLGSIINMFGKIGVSAKISADKAEIENAEKLLLPGVGAFDTAMDKIARMDLVPVLNHCALIRKIPVLGICLGMHLLSEGSEEGKLKGLGWIKGTACRFAQNVGQLKVPHMGWNNVTVSTQSPLTTAFNEAYRFYFCHSYYLKCENENEAILKTTYGVAFDAAVQKDNIFGTQFHPEKSHKYGLQLFRNFAAL